MSIVASVRSELSNNLVETLAICIGVIGIECSIKNQRLEIIWVSVENLNLVGLLANPRERLDVEIKSWLDLSDNRHRAKLAQAAIALANHGGGIIILGMKEDKSQTSGYVSEKSKCERYTGDQVNSAIGKYADPTFDCELHFACHPETAVEHAFLLVPGRNDRASYDKKNAARFSSQIRYISENQRQ